MMHGYSDFPKDVKTIFEEIIYEYNLHVEFESANKIILKSENCIIQLMTEYDYVQFHFKQIENENWMFLGPFLEAVHPNDNIIFYKSPEDLSKIEKIRFSLMKELDLIKNYCLPILKGDFSWRNKYHI